jgi:hypothetical protein
MHFQNVISPRVIRIAFENIFENNQCTWDIVSENCMTLWKNQSEFSI